MIQNNEVPSFEGLGIAPNILEVLKTNNFVNPTPIQHQVIPAAVQGKDVVGIAQTGTGKTLAFGIPLIQGILATRKTGLVLLPTRELALQVNEVLEKIGKHLGVKTAVLIGGASMWKQKIRLQSKPDIVIATPGRLADHLKQKTYTLSRVKIVVLDEADRMLDIGFLPEINRILAVCPADRQTMLFSATMPTEIAKIAAQHMKLPLRIEVAPAGTASETIEQEVFIVGKDSKMRLLDKILAENKGSVLIFSRTKHGAKKIVKSIMAMGHKAAEIHSNRSLNQRIIAMEGFKSGKFRVLVATDIAARGIDISHISLVVNFDLPDNSEDYVHRIGRTGRAGRVGKAISFATPDQKYDIRQIERLIRKTLPILALPELPPARVGETLYADRGPKRGNFNRSNFGQRSGGNGRGRFGRGGEKRGKFNRREDRPRYDLEPASQQGEGRQDRGRFNRDNAGRSNDRGNKRGWGAERRVKEAGRQDKPFNKFRGNKAHKTESQTENVYQDDYSRWKRAYNNVSSSDRYEEKRRPSGKKFFVKKQNSGNKFNRTGRHPKRNNFSGGF